ncbi:MAG: AAA domain-containing protein [Nitrospiraceae bacterium]
MAGRDFRRLGIEELERLSSESPHDMVLVKWILDELSYRTTSRAQALKRKLEAQVKVGQPTKSQIPPEVSVSNVTVLHTPPKVAGEATQVNRAEGRRTETEKVVSMSEPIIQATPVRANPNHQAGSTEQVSPSNSQASQPKPELTPTQRGVTQLIDYVRVLIGLSDKPVWSLASYSNVVLHEDVLRNRIGIHHDLSDGDGPIYLKIDRLRRIDPPEPPESAKDWLTVARDPFSEPVIQTLRTTVMSGTEAEQHIAKGVVDPADVSKSLKPKPGEDLHDVILRLDRFPEAKAKINSYIAGDWAQWAQAERPRRETINIYDRLFSVQQAVKLEGSDKPLEIVWGMGMARWKVPPNELDHPLIEQLVEFELDDAGAIIVRPRGVDPIAALKPFVAMQNPGTDLVARYFREHFSKLPPDQELSPFDKESFTPILRYACAQFDRAGRYHPDTAKADDRKVPAAGPNLIVTDTWVLYARPRSENYFSADLERLREAVEKSEALPAPSIALVSKPSDEVTYKLGGGLMMGESSAGGGSTSIEDARRAEGGAGSRQYFFPKPFNDEQIAIVERLESDDVEGVVVQGPPGTGKTHTIANIICHYLATGRRVLVTSKSEGALTVLRDQIPEGVRDLAISLLTSEREGLKQLETTVNVLASKIASLDTRSTERDIIDSEKRLAELTRRINVIDTEMRRFAEKHLSRIGGGENTDGILPIELAERIIRDRDRYDWFTDRPELSDANKPQFGDAEIAAARSARKKVGVDLAYLGATLPSVADLPDAANLAAIHQDLASAARIERARQSDSPVMSSVESNLIARAEALLAAVDALVTAHETCASAPWLSNLYLVWRRGGIDAEAARPLAQLISSVSHPIHRRTTIASYAVAVPDNAHTQTDLVEAITRAAAGQRPFGLIPLGRSDARSAFADIRILNRTPAREDDWKRVVDVVQWRGEVATALVQWRALSPEYLLPELPDRLEDCARALQTLLEHTNIVAEAISKHIPLLQTEVARLFPYGMNAAEIASSIDHARRAADAIRSEISRQRLGSSRVNLASAIEKLKGCNGAISRTLETFLQATVGNPELPVNDIVDGWTNHLIELERLRALRPSLETVARVAHVVSESGAPQWARQLLTQPVDGVEDGLTPENWRDAWTWAQAASHLRSIDGRTRLRELDEQRRQADDEIMRLFNNVVKLRTLLTLRARITRRVDAALQMFLTAIRKIGKGTGKSASRLRRDARDAMESSYAAVPCWIMPSWRISESLPATLASFDLVIIDEASQSDIGVLPALLRAKKVLIVGDDKQVSPTAAFIEETKLRSLRMHYLDGQPFGALMLPGNSLYELALACYPGRRIMLREHFRCVEPIIRFSFQFYTEEIVPVRLPKASERLSPPLIDVYVPNGRKDKSNRNLAEAEAIVDEVEKIVADPLMRARSIGIISLIGAKQAQLIQMLLLERIGEDAYVRHDIACGDSAVFQGKERDIVLLSMVECANTCTSKTALPFQQRFNVALSRARDRQYLFRSVSEEKLKPDDLKAKVLRHFKHPMEGRGAPADDLMKLCDSGFERDVLRRLLDLGYRVQPQVKVGPYSIDLVVEGKDDRRLAIELDGDQYHGPERWAEDLARQRVMERVGWRFWRCWGSSFRLDPESCMDDLVRGLSSLQIEPIGLSETPTIWTEFRTYAPKDKGADPEPASDQTPVKAEAEVAPTHARADMDNVVEIGDRVQVQVSGDTRVRVVTLTANQHDPDLGFISVAHPSGKALQGAEEDDEIEFEIDKKVHRWMVVKIEKARLRKAA